MKTLLCAVAKNEDDYLFEWLKYHKSLGFSHVIVWDNNEKDVLEKKILSSEFKTFCSIEKKFIGKKTFIQGDAYKITYEKEFKNYDWIAYIDIDEFLVIKDGVSLATFLSNPLYKNFEEIRICWKLYGDNDLIYKEEGNVVDRFKNPLSKEFVHNKQCKSIVRGNLSSRYFSFAAHGTKNVKACNTLGIPCDPYTPVIGKECIWDYAYINHYRTKSLEEYLNYKILCNNQWRTPISLLKIYFEMNSFSDKKLDFIKLFFKEKLKMNDNQIKEIESELYSLIKKCK